MVDLPEWLSTAKMFGQALYYTGVVLRDGGTLNAGQVVEDLARSQPERSALLFEDRRYSYASFNNMANRVSGVLASLGAQAGDVVALLMDNRPEYLFAVTGANKLGVVTALLNTHVTGAHLLHALQLAKPRFVIVGDEHLGSLREITDELPLPMAQVLVWAESQSAEPLPGARDLRELLGNASEANPTTTGSRRTRDPMVYIYTSGTTGLPKAALIKHQRFLRAGLIFGRSVLQLSAEDVAYVAMPLYHASAFVTGWGVAICTGGAVALRRKFSASAFWDDVTRYQATWFPYIGELCRYLVQAPEHPNERAHRLRLMFGAGLRPDVWTRFVERFGIGRVVEYYASTEGNVALVNVAGKPGMLGQLLPGQTVVKVDASTEELVRDAGGYLLRARSGEQGVLIGKIDRMNKFDGYLDPQKTEGKVLRNAFGDGKSYFNTGDLVNLHAYRWVSFADRLGDTFRWKGENVSTTEVSFTLNQQRGVIESNVYGVEVPGADGRAGMVALVVDDDFDIDAFAAHVQNKLPSYARPVFVRLQRKLQLTGSFKYVKTHLKKQGFDPSQIEEPLYFLDSDAQRYVRLDPQLYAKVKSGVRML